MICQQIGILFQFKKITHDHASILMGELGKLGEYFGFAHGCIRLFVDRKDNLVGMPQALPLFADPFSG